MASDNIRKLTPLGQMLMAQMKARNLSLRRTCKMLRLAFDTWEKCLSGRLDTISPPVKEKLKRWLGVSHLPEAPEDLSLMWNVMAVRDNDYVWTPPDKAFEQVKELRGTLHMRHYLLAYANRLSEHIWGLCDGLLAVEIHTRFTRYGAAASVILDVFATDKPLTKLRLVLSLSGEMTRLEYALGEFSQASSSELMPLGAGILTKDVMKDVLTRLIPAFCFKNRPNPELTALDSALRPKEKINDVSYYYGNTGAAGAGSGESSTCDNLHAAGPGQVSVRKRRFKSYRKRRFKRGRGGRPIND